MIIPYELALLAQKRGFNQPSLWCYHNVYGTYEPITRLEYNEEFEDPDTLLPAPLYQQILDWLRITHFIHIKSMPFSNGKIFTSWEWCIINIDKKYKNGIPIKYSPRFTSIDYYYGLNEAIRQCFSLINDL